MSNPPKRASPNSPPETHRYCPNCDRTLPVDQFHRNKAKPRGFESGCKECRRARRAAYYQKNRDKSRATTQAYAARHKEKIVAYRAALAAETLATASNYGAEWTGAELEIVLRDDITMLEIAKLLGRTHQAVGDARFKATHQPRERFLSGESTEL